MVILAFIYGQERLASMMKPVHLPDFLREYRGEYSTLNRIRGTALFFTNDIDWIPRYIARILFKNEIIYDENILVCVRTEDYPFGIETKFEKNLSPGLHTFLISAGYMEIVDIVALLRAAGIQEKTIFYGIENVVTDKPFWILYSIIKKVSPPFVQFYKLPAEEIHGVVTRIEM